MYGNWSTQFGTNSNSSLLHMWMTLFSGRFRNRMFQCLLTRVKSYKRQACVSCVGARCIVVEGSGHSWMPKFVNVGWLVFDKKQVNRRGLVGCFENVHVEQFNGLVILQSSRGARKETGRVYQTFSRGFSSRPRGEPGPPPLRCAPPGRRTGTF